MTVALGPWLGPMPEEYYAFLKERGVPEAAVYPLVQDPRVFVNPEFLQAFVELILVVARGGHQEDVDRVQALIEAMNPGANANFLVRSINRLLTEHFSRAGLSVSEGVLATGVFPMRFFGGRSVPRQHGVLILLETGCLEFLEYCVSLDHLEHPSLDERATLLADAVHLYSETGAFPQVATLGGAEWRRRQLLILHGVNWAEWFVLSHEYAHHALKHFDRVDAAKVEHTAGDHTFEVIRHDHVAEYEADLWALSALLRIAASGAPPVGFARIFAWAAPLYFLGILALVERTWKQRGRSRDIYPPAVNRIMSHDLLLKWFGEKSDWAIRGRVDALIDLASKKLFGSGLEFPAHDKPLQRDLANIMLRVCKPMFLEN
jgi:hypothetical protein